MRRAHPLLIRPVAQGWIGPLGERGEELGVMQTHGRDLAAARELLGSELTDRLEQPVAVAACVSTPTDEALVDEGLQGVHAGIADRFGRLMCAAVDEDGESREEPLLIRLQQVVGPANRRPQRLLSRIRITTSLEEVQPLTQTLEELFGREDHAARGCELERQRKIVEAPAELGYRGCLLEGGVGLASPGQEELGAVSRRQRRHRVCMFGLQPQSLAARDEKRRPSVGKQSRDAGCDLRQEMLRIVEEQQ
jgi:hypothetical protein